MIMKGHHCSAAAAHLHTVSHNDMNRVPRAYREDNELQLWPSQAQCEWISGATVSAPNIKKVYNTLQSRRLHLRKAFVVIILISTPFLEHHCNWAASSKNPHSEWAVVAEQMKFRTQWHCGSFSVWDMILYCWLIFTLSSLIIFLHTLV